MTTPRGALATLALVLLATACSPAFQPTGESAPAAGPGWAVPPNPIPAAPAESGSSRDQALDRAGGAVTSPSSGPSAEMPLASTLDRLIVRTADVKLAVPNVRQAIDVIERIATGAGGLVFSSSFSTGGDREAATVTLRVPPDEQTFHEVLDQLVALEGAVVTDRSIQSQDVTEEFTDLEARRRSLQATEARLLALLERATQLQDILALERELANVRGQIERIEGRQRLLERRLELATIVVTLRQAPPELGGWSLREAAAGAWASLLAATRLLAVALVWLVVWLPVYGALLLLGWLLYRRYRPSRASS